jgi:hypothetical protein
MCCVACLATWQGGIVQSQCLRLLHGQGCVGSYTNAVADVEEPGASTDPMQRTSSLATVWGEPGMAQKPAIGEREQGTVIRLWPLSGERVNNPLLRLTILACPTPDRPPAETMAANTRTASLQWVRHWWWWSLQRLPSSASRYVESLGPL